MSKRRARKSSNPQTVAEHFACMTRSAVSNRDRDAYSRLVDAAAKTSVTQVNTRRGIYYIFHDRSWLCVRERFWEYTEFIRFVVPRLPFADSQPCGIGGAGCVCSQRCKRVAFPRKRQPASPSARSATSQGAVDPAQIGKDLETPVWRN